MRAYKVCMRVSVCGCVGKFVGEYECACICVYMCIRVCLCMCIYVLVITTMIDNILVMCNSLVLFNYII